MLLENVNLASLKTLCLVHDLGSFSKAAERLNKSQSAVSYTIAELRKIFADQLFIRNGMEIDRTERCQEIVVSARKLVFEIENLAEPIEFDPLTSDGVVRISCNYFERLTILPGLMRILRKKAPQLTVEIIQATYEGAGQLKQGECDLFLSPVTMDGNEIYSKFLFEEEYVCVMAPDNPIAGKDIDLNTYSSAPHVLVNYGGKWKSFFVRELEGKGISLNVKLGIPSPAGLQHLLRGTDMISTVPRRIAENLGDEVHIATSPIPSLFTVYMYWSARTQHSMMHRWFRNELMDILK